MTENSSNTTTDSGRPIVVGVDRSDSARCAVRWAAEDAARHGSGLTLVHALVPLDPVFAPVAVIEAWDVELEERRGQELLDEARELAIEAAEPFGGVTVTTELPRGPVVSTLLHAAKDARMVAVGSRGLGALRRGLLGSTSSALPRHAHCPVAVVHEAPAGTHGRVLVGVDGTANSARAVEIAFEEAALRGAELVAVHAWTDLSELDAYGVRFPNPYGAPFFGAEESESAVLAEALAGWAERYPDVHVERAVVADRPARHLLERSADADLIVVGSHGRGGFAGMLLGSTSQALLHAVSCPIIVARGES